MDEAFVAMLVMSSAMVELPPHLEALANDEDWWKRLEETAPKDLDADQREMIRRVAPEAGF